MFDDETQKALRTHHAEACRVIRTAAGLAQLVSTFRTQLIVGGFKPRDATEMARDYLGRLLDESDGEGGGGE